MDLTEETFASVANMAYVQALLGIAVVRHWPLLQMVVKNVFIHGDLLEMIYIQPHPGYACPPKHICRLRNLCMASNKLREHGLTNFTLLSFVLNSTRALMIALSSFEGLPVDAPFCYASG